MCYKQLSVKSAVLVYYITLIYHSIYKLSYGHLKMKPAILVATSEGLVNTF